MRLTLLILAGALAIGGCTTGADVGALTAREWKLEWIEGFDALPGDVATPTLRFGTDGRAGGNTGCNSAGGDYTAEGDRLTFGALAMTRRACVNPEGNRLERAYVDALERTRRYRISGERLELLDESGRVLARFA